MVCKCAEEGYLRVDVKDGAARQKNKKIGRKES